MEISFKKTKHAKTFNQQELLIKEYGKSNGGIIMRRMAVLRAAANLAQVPHLKPERRHELGGSRKGEFAVDLLHPYRLTFCPDHNPVPLNKDGGIDLDRVTSIKIIGVEDYH